MIQDTMLPMSFLLGALHAIEPGHGKTAMVAYMADPTRNFRHALMMSLGTALSHTGTLFVIALMTHAAGHALTEGHSHPLNKILEWTGALSILAIGIYLLLKRFFGSHKSARSCSHHHHSPSHGAKIPFLLGMSGGLIPCPTALAAYMSGIASGQTTHALGILLVFSIGVMVAMMIVAVMAKRLGASLARRPKWENLIVNVRVALILGVGLAYVTKLSWD